jgi:branched-chain amino acid transport system substrate-binding protein
MKKFLAMMLALVMALSLVACGEQGDSQKGDDSASGDKVVKIGVFEPTSGQNGGGGKKEILGVEYAHSLKPTVTINGEEYSVQLVYADNASDQAKAPTAAQTLISQGVSVVIGTYGSACAIAASPLFESAKIPAIGTSCTNPQVTAGNDYYFRVGYIDPFQGAVMANFAFNEKGSSNCALIIESGDDYSAGFGNYFRQEMERLGGKATTLEFQKGEADFSTIMASIKSEGYDGIFAPVSIETAAMIISQARDAGITCPIMAGDTWDDISIAQRTGSKATDIYFSAFFDAADTTNEAGKAFVDGFTKWVAEDATRVENNGGVSDVISSVTPCGYDAYMAAVGAIEAAQSTDGATIRDALATLEISGLITGDLKFDENGDAIKNYAVIKTIENGEIVYFSTFNGLE